MFKKFIYCGVSLSLLTVLFSNLDACKRSRDESVSHEEHDDTVDQPSAKRQKIENSFIVIDSSQDMGSYISSPHVEVVDFNKFPTAGRDAFWAYHPHNPSQKILFVPSIHTLNLRFINPTLIRAMKEADFLVVESKTKTITWDDALLFQRSLYYDIKSLKLNGAIRETPFEFQDNPWTSAIPNATLHSIEKLFKDNLGDTPLSGIHPFIVAVTLRRMRSIKEKLMGAMDEQILKEFTLKRKPIFFLETIGDLVAKVCQKTNTELISQFFIKQTTLEEIICDAQQLELLSKEMPKPHYEKVNECGAMMVQQYYLNPQFAEKIIDQDLIKRNTLWIPRLMQYFADHPDKSFVVVAGAAHFPSDHGILKLLADLGMSFSVFDQSIAQNQKPLPPFKAKQPEYKLEKEIAAAEEEKIKTRTKALDLADVFLKKDLPTLNTHFGIDQKFVVNISELVITMFRILKTKPGLVPAEYRILLMNYIMTKDAIYDASEITDKNKTFEMLHANPLLIFEQLKQEAKAIS